MSKQPKVVLASASPRRKELLASMGIVAETMASEVDELSIPADHPRTFAIRAAYAKATEVASRVPEGAWVIGADTVVTREMILYGKPNTTEEARRTLLALSGQVHDVITGIALVRAGSTTSYLHAERTRVYFRELNEQDIDSYIATGEPMDKAGAYGIQGRGGDLIERIEGDYYNVVGLPCRALATLLEESGESFAIRLPEVPKRWASR